MKCVICKHGDTRPGRTTVTLQRGGSTVIFKDVPANICENCGEYYLTGEVTSELLERADAAAESGAEVQVLAYAA